MLRYFDLSGLKGFGEDEVHVPVTFDLPAEKDPKIELRLMYSELPHAVQLCVIIVAKKAFVPDTRYYYGVVEAAARRLLTSLVENAASPPASYRGDTVTVMEVTLATEKKQSMAQLLFKLDKHIHDLLLQPPPLPPVPREHPPESGNPYQSPGP